MAPTSLELSTLGHRIRHQRVSNGFTLDELGERVGVAGSQLSLIENGKREPKLSLLQAIAEATGVEVADLLSNEPPNKRAALEIELEKASVVPDASVTRFGIGGAFVYVSTVMIVRTENPKIITRMVA